MGEKKLNFSLLCRETQVTADDVSILTAICQFPDRMNKDVRILLKHLSPKGLEIGEDLLGNPSKNPAAAELANYLRNWAKGSKNGKN